MHDEEREWILTFTDGSTEREWGRLTINDGAVWITKRGPYNGPIERQSAYPLTALRKWERSR
jgi:hypothetical protein